MEMKLLAGSRSFLSLLIRLWLDITLHKTGVEVAFLLQISF
jgi:hypothetical protein